MFGERCDNFALIAKKATIKMSKTQETFRQELSQNPKRRTSLVLQKVIHAKALGHKGDMLDMFPFNVRDDDVFEGNEEGSNVVLLRD